ncbi:MAG TPA: bifunctional adenosylcobinamide kinase/adenosylcobinamide-phosphate guanylyltransferase, partial [Rubrivivax sp.]|nr:bifunctional adenosylcobinamide kinase/adenosylcobinamide-phosphate guanylyltransferase [Rubrivivax sp.]
MHELILGGAKSGKSRCAEMRAAAWLAGGPQRSARLLATAVAGDAEMAERIARHRADRAARVPQLEVVEVGAALGQAISDHAAPHRLLIVDCLTLWLTQRMLPLGGPPRPHAQADVEALTSALARCPVPVVLVSNEIGMGVLPMSPEMRRFVD